MIRIIKRAGLKPWHNLQATRQTELADQFPAHVVCEWEDNSPAVAKEHYLRVTDEHYDQAMQKAVHQPATIGKLPILKRRKTPIKRGIVSEHDLLAGEEVGDTGFEPVTSAV